LADAGWITRLVYRELKKRIGLVPKSKTLAAYNTRPVGFDLDGRNLRFGHLDSRCAQGTSAIEGGDDGRLPVLNRPPFCRRQKSRDYGGSIARSGAIRREPGVQLCRKTRLAARCRNDKDARIGGRRPIHRPASRVR